MRVFWHNGALQLLPETAREGQLLAELYKNLKFERPAGTQGCIPAGDCSLGSEGLFEATVSDEKTGPRRLTRKTNNKQFVVSIDKLP